MGELVLLHTGTVPSYVCTVGVSGRLVGPAAFKAVEGSLTRLLVGSIPIHSRCL